MVRNSLRLALVLWAPTLLYGQEQREKFEAEYQAAVKAAEQRLQEALSKAQSRYLTEIREA